MSDYINWLSRHERITALQAELAASRSEQEADHIEERLAELRDQEQWPATWKAYEEHVQDDPAFWREMSQQVSMRYGEIMDAREAEAPAEAAVEEVWELEESA
ncbi:hypothetical protein IU421_30215 [Nocardia cyriacigeorgica]|uniref:hypothetical protein n=1 Tax=Nocardia cyriacigeorgica TaxID=135487 RepID=UPI001895BEA5|nr:hypothetical protein [Nocardia cyriacigeorgica]MBF6163074.1 hypothetical protein [Nocardia cyriacigeorgica]MBF6202042.1 hypothetical protein [Nocardia cyriacigeorgica]MBF6518522.1 hypothetical protein [Nocardia cyriacigeorgica]